MGKVDTYKNILAELPDWDTYLWQESGLPGPRGNLELLEAFVELGDAEIFTRYAESFDSATAPTNSPGEFLATCGIAGYGKLITQGKIEYFERLRLYANDIRWRVREGVAIALQTVGEKNIELLLGEMIVWSDGGLLEKRAVTAALCEPKLLVSQDTQKKVLAILDKITVNLLNTGDRKSENFKTLRKTLGYGWSVATAAAPHEGKAFMEKWLVSEDKDIKWIMRENLRKERLMRMDREWTEYWKRQ